MAATTGYDRDAIAASVIVPVFGNLEQARSTLSALLAQRLDGGAGFEIVVVDDGSPDATADALEAEFATHIRLYRNPVNLGRARTRNIGVQQAGSRYVVLLDSDCVPSDRRFLAHHLRILESGAVATCGSVAGYGGGFWDRYQRAASARRESLMARGVAGAGTTANMAFNKSAFLEVGGFDTKYQRYGFEDRDLLMRLATLGRVVWVSDASVIHGDDLSAAAVCRKMREAGRYNAERFATVHVEAYQALSYARFDARLNPWLRPMGRIASVLAPTLAAATDLAVSIPSMPFPIASALMRGAGMLSFLTGTWEATKADLPPSDRS
ncbi:GT2 family glycosyltransferase [Luteimonas cucumeris]|uniref:GT2 family glycosyltransferase n=1 Tax=Luteimonas cucumeris TaxID=985012 RepID=A0A562L5C9_9GAMM|nr:glycosyltransferase [Luteimonas cucumeris]TWI02887.1 GT2 family glycosyltransferase [Luteimonas cucumeris]